MKWKWNWCYLESYIAFSLIRQLKRTRDLLLQLNCNRRRTKWKFKIEWLKFETLEEEKKRSETDRGRWVREVRYWGGHHRNSYRSNWSRKSDYCENIRESAFWCEIGGREIQIEKTKIIEVWEKMGLWLWWQGFSFFFFSFLIFYAAVKVAVSTWLWNFWNK
jgi:hypothetical protein